MANKAMRPCAAPGCTTLTIGTYCQRHKKALERHPVAYRALYTDKVYRAARKVFMAEHPFCAVCGAPATDLDHIRPHKGDKELFWDPANWQALCASCHSRKTAKEDGGYGNRRRPARE